MLHHEEEAPSNLLPVPDQQELSRMLSLFTARQAHHYTTMARLSATLANSEQAHRHRWDERDTAEMDALLAQYESLRNESLNTIANRIQVLMLGIAAVAAVAGGALTLDNPPAKAGVVYAIFSGAIPLVCVFVLLVWLTEAVRSRRVGYFLAGDVESRINVKLGRLALTWEASLWTGRQPRDERFGPSMAALGVVGIIAGCSPVFGVYLTKGFEAGWWWPLFSAPIVSPYLFLIGSSAYVLKHWKQLENNPLVCSTWPGEDDTEARIQANRVGA